MSNHTPLPWFHDRVEGDTYSHISSKPGEGGDIATTWVTGDVNAAFIVKACNAHDKLVEALKEIAEVTRLDRCDDPDFVVEIAKEALRSIKERS